MKKIIIVIGILLFCSLVNIPASANTKETFFKETNKLWAISSEFELKESSPGLMLKTKNKVLYIYNNQEVCSIEETYLTHTIDSENLYLVTKDEQKLYLRSINLNTKKESLISLAVNDCYDISIINNELTLFGSTNNDASITKYTKKLSFLYDYTFGGEGQETFLKGYYHNNKYYLIGQKDAHSINSPFLDVGSLNEKKVFITIISDKGIIEDSIYFNHNEMNEDLYTSSFNNNEMMVSIKLANCYQTYIINSALEKVYHEVSNDMNFNIVLSNTGNILYISNDYLKVKDQMFSLTITGQILFSEMRDNVLKIYYYDNYYIWEALIYQYNIDNQQDIIVNLFNTDFDPKMSLEELEELKISSYIHNLDLELNSIEPYFLKQITGDYIGHFKLKINEQKSFIIDNKIKVEEYVNIYDQHIYPVGYKLKFFGYGMLDGKSIASGVVLTEVGEHVLLISDVEGKTKKYTFQIVDNYYNQQEELPPTDYTIRQNDQLEITFHTSDRLEKVYINNEEMSFEQVENTVKVILDNFKETGIYEYKINKVEGSKGVKNINKKFTIKVLKEEPLINIFELDNENFTLNIDFYDPDLALKDLVFEVYYEDELKEICHTYLNNFNYKVGNIQKDKKISIRGFLVYDIGDGVLKQIKIIDSSFTLNEEYELFHITREDNNIKLVMNTNNPKLLINDLIVNETNFKEKYQTIINYQPLYISLILSGLVILIGGGCIYYFKVFKKKKKY